MNYSLFVLMTRVFEAIPDTEEAVDGFTWEEIKRFTYEGVAQARCTECCDYAQVEPDAEGYDCESCGAERSITSPLIKLGLLYFGKEEQERRRKEIWVNG